ncbi:septal ring lytic transglycosylase RlpA family protein [Parerythrobacter lacustris]|uniref:Endolytic peptidoglycan transglycosylase RlpA n=1 Tax=Parerythrobacter lacustris TaxID=2969984 RepID=A0ABT1XV39_9SPHN|nr:septal ring lytic transglycosylase RlpA family protein [Parerythrobacter lacustris]MCR2834510.1 septal ring lytic transglycosylase RlpA family protein [Parerythrobacter lacustris]
MTKQPPFLRALVASVLLVAPLNAASPAATNTGLDASFALYDVELAAPLPSGNVVDLEAIEPAVEPEPEAVSLGSGVASYYANKFHGRRTASGERFDMHAMTAAHRTLPFGSKVRVTNPANGKVVVVRINDRGPFSHGRTIDLSRAAASEIGLIARGSGTVHLELLK